MPRKYRRKGSHRMWVRPRGTILIFACVIFGLILFFNATDILRIFYPIPHLEIIKQEARDQQVDPLLIAAVIRTESKFLSKATSRSGARGLMQIMPDTGEWIAEQRGEKSFSQDKLFEPETNIKYGSWYLADLRKEFGGDLVLVIAAYNAGRGNVKKWLEEKKWTGEHTALEQIPFPETRQYVKRVLRNYEIYKRLYPDI